ncbi:MAG TPA: 3' terminal RNA ribose 2'-O-methyltransferase Hen1 [Actinomycetota bacterium]|nr:3' terminal RNA ribose 2'-O-methyltransferase Hen1 [Actinomycetota bacterium]
MLLTLSTTHRPATDLGFLLHKNPWAIRSIPLSFGMAHVFYTEASEQRCTAALLLEVDPVALVRGRKGSTAPSAALAQYVNDRPYAASSFMSVALAKLFGTAMGGRSADRQELADTPIPVEVHIPVLPCRGGEEALRKLVEPLGYEVTSSPIPLDERFPEWGMSRYLDATFTAKSRVAEVLNHFYVLLPVLDDEKHYWVSSDEIDKLLRRGGDWLRTHPERELITRRYLRYQGRLTREALARLLEEDHPDPDLEEARHDREEDQVEERIGLRDQRIGTVLAALRAAGVRKVVDLGCGGGRLLQALLRDVSFERIVGVDVSYAALERAARRLRLEQMSLKQRERIELLQSSLTYRDRRLEGYDAAAVVEVIEHLDPPRLGAFERNLFGAARPGIVVLTTPNIEHNVRFEGLPAGSLRHRDHRFEWTRAQFRDWATRTAEAYGYSVRFVPVGPDDPEVGPPTQMAVFTK